MNEFTTSAIVFACILGGALTGLHLGKRLPGHHLTEDSKDIVKLAIGVVATMAALVLGLLVSSAKGSFDKMNDELTLVGTKVLLLDTALANYGPETKTMRGHLRTEYQAFVDTLFSGDGSFRVTLRDAQSGDKVTGFQVGVLALAPRNDEQRELRSRALALVRDVAAERWLLVLQTRNSISTSMLVVVVSWLTLIFVGFGLYSPRNITVVASLLLSSLCVSGAIFLILEMDTPLQGVVRVSDAPMRSALAILSAR